MKKPYHLAAPESGLLSGLHFSSQKSKRPAVAFVDSFWSAVGHETTDCSEMVKHKISYILDHDNILSTHRVWARVSPLKNEGHKSRASAQNRTCPDYAVQPCQDYRVFCDWKTED